jgi:hypothetical protein
MMGIYSGRKVNKFGINLGLGFFGGIRRAKGEKGGIIGRRVEKFGKGVVKMKTFNISEAKLDKRAKWDISR